MRGGWHRGIGGPQRVRHWSSPRNASSSSSEEGGAHLGWTPSLPRAFPGEVSHGARHLFQSRGRASHGEGPFQEGPTSSRSRRPSLKGRRSREVHLVIDVHGKGGWARGSVPLLPVRAGERSQAPVALSIPRGSTSAHRARACAIPPRSRRRYRDCARKSRIRAENARLGRRSGARSPLVTLPRSPRSCRRADESGVKMDEADWRSFMGSTISLTSMNHIRCVAAPPARRAPPDPEPPGPFRPDPPLRRRGAPLPPPARPRRSSPPPPPPRPAGTRASFSTSMRRRPRSA